jgi:hypothetical protein
MSESSTQGRLIIVEFDERIKDICSTHWIVPVGRNNYYITLFDLVYFRHLKPKYITVVLRLGNIYQTYEKLYKIVYNLTYKYELLSWIMVKDKDEVLNWIVVKDKDEILNWIIVKDKDETLNWIIVKDKDEILNWIIVKDKDEILKWIIVKDKDEVLNWIIVKDKDEILNWIILKDPVLTAL